MNLDDLKVIWDSQNTEPLYAIDGSGLQTMLRENTARFERRMCWQRRLTYLGAFVAVAPMVILLLLHFVGLIQLQTGWDVLALFIAAAAWLQFAGRVLLGWRRQSAHARQFSSSLRDELERDIAHVSYQIRERRRIMLGFVPPSVAALLLTGVVFRLVGMTHWALLPVLALLLVNLVVESRSQQRLVENELVPRLHELESLRDKLSAL